MKLTGLNKYEIFQGEDIWLPMILVGPNGEPIFLPGNWTRMTVKIGSGATVLTKSTDVQAEVYAYCQGPGAMFNVKLSPLETAAMAANKELDISVILETNQPGMLKQVFPYPKALKVLASQLAT